MSTQNSKELALSRVHPDYSGPPEFPAVTDADDWQFLCGAESSNFNFQHAIRELKRLADCQDRTSKVVTERKSTGVDLTGDISGTFNSAEDGRWLAEQCANPANTSRIYLRVTVPGFCHITGHFIVTNFQFTGQDLEGNMTFSANISVDGDYTFTAIPAA